MYIFLKAIDKLPTGPEWTCELIQIYGNLESGMTGEDNTAQDNETEEAKLWMHDPVACVRELISNPACQIEMVYTPEKVDADSNREPNDMMICGWVTGGGKPK